MTDAAPSHAKARTLAAEAWAELREPLDRQLSPLGLRAMDALSPQRGEVVLDVGCGSGQTVLQLAGRVGAEGRVLGIDIAPLLLDIARARAEGLSRVDFIAGDAARLDLPPASVDAIFSRFGVMAFSDPAIAFSNLRRLLKPGGRLAFVCWRALQDNELDLLPLRAAALGDRVDPTPFSFSDPSSVRTTLHEAGFNGIAIVAHDAAVTCGDLDTTVEVLLRVGALGKIVRENPDLRGAAEPLVRAALAARRNPDSVALRAATWIVTARA